MDTLFDGTFQIDKANNALDAWKRKYTAEFMKAWKEIYIRVDHPEDVDLPVGSRRLVGGEIVEAGWGPAGFEIYIAWWDDKTESYRPARMVL